MVFQELFENTAIRFT